MAEAVYLLCAATSLGCAILLLRSYLRIRTQLLLWSSLCFIGLALNNVLLFVDLVVAPSIDLSIPRNLTALCALMLLIFGLIWNTE
jgi:hypothetical protein